MAVVRVIPTQFAATNPCWSTPPTGTWLVQPAQPLAAFTLA